MKTAGVLALLGALFLSAAGLGALGGRETKAPLIEVSGRVRLAGSGFQPSLVLSGENREWHIDGKDRETLMSLQQQVVTVRGREYYVDQTFANGLSAGRRYFLKDIEIVKTSGGD